MEMICDEFWNQIKLDSQPDANDVNIKIQLLIDHDSVRHTIMVIDSSSFFDNIML